MRVLDWARRQLRADRLVLLGAALVLAAALWMGQMRVHPASDAAQGPAPAALSPEQQVRASPSDPAAWQSLAEAKFAAGQYDEAVAAYSHALSLAPGHAVLWAARGEARVMASAHDPMPAEALADFHKAFAIDAREPRARYFLAVDQDLHGDHAGAITEWLALLADTPPGAPWEPDLRRTIEQVGRINHIPVAQRLAALHQPAPVPLSLPGPTAQDLAAASALPLSQQNAMAQGMVARLEQRLQAQPHDPEGWTMLIRSRMILGDPDKARQALARAVAADPDDAAAIKAAAQSAGVR